MLSPPFGRPQSFSKGRKIDRLVPTTEPVSREDSTKKGNRDGITD